jgi:PAS domain S-box-containing protein
MSIGVERRLTLAPAPDSARTARRLVAEVLSSARAEHFADTATLLTSELVTNGIVHAHTELKVVVDATQTWVRVEVVDGNPNLPVRRGYDENAGTGRGMEMVELLADDFGVESLEEDGKRVWFRLGEAPGTPRPREHSAQPREDSAEASAGLSGRTVTHAQLQAVPVALYCAWQQHAEALLREATLFALEDADGTGVTHDDHPLAGRALAALADAASGLFSARDDGLASADVDLDLPAEAVPWFPVLRDVLARATVLAVAGKLLTPPSLPEIMAVRRWVCDEIARQSAGLPPTPWMDQADEHPRPAPMSASLLDEVRRSPLAQIGADATNRIVAVSEAAADLLGWSPDELAGQRLVAIIPPRLRDRHIAGFNRYLLEGTSRIIGQPVAVPALRKDREEILVELLIERRPDRGSRGLFVATLTPQ